ncbi:cytochrome p450 [Pyrenophora teres f. maculata]|nr:cytochrome p450 [Pyrenophora teres f. maculata]
MNIILRIFSLGIASIVGWLVYNILFHPLRRYPGPLLWRASPIPRILSRKRGTTVFDAHRLHEKYGPVVRLSPWELSYTSSDAWKDIHGTGSTAPRKPLPKNPLANPPPMSGEPGIIDVLDDEKHREQRQLFMQGFSTRALKEQESLLRKHVDKLVAAVQSRADQGIHANMVDMFNFLAFDIMGDLAFGTSLGLLERSEYNDWVRVIVATIKVVTIRIVVFYHIPFAPKILPLLVPKSMKAKRDAHMKFAEDRVRERLERKTERPDLWGLITNSADGKKANLSVDQMVGNAALFMVVGSETTSTVLSGTLYLLLKHPECMARLKQEIKDNFASKEEMTLEALPKLRYLSAVLDEAMRVYPAAPETLARLVPAGGTTICGEYVPQGATVFILHYPTFHSTRNFVRPESFAPERWLPEGEIEFARDDKKAFNPFSVGPRACLGRNLAQYELRLTLSHLLWDFEFELDERCNDWMAQETYSFWLKPPLLVKVKAANAEP